MVYKDFYGGSDIEYTTITKVSSANDNNNNQTLDITSTQGNIQVFDDIGKNTEDLCRSLHLIITSFSQLICANNNNYDYDAIRSCSLKLKSKVLQGISDLNTIITALIESMNKMKKMKVEPNDISKVRNCNETFEEALQPIIEYLNTIKPEFVLMLNQYIDIVKQKKVDEHNLKFPSNKITVNQFETSPDINTDGFKSEVNTILSNTPLWFIIINKFPLGLFVNGRTKIKHDLKNIIHSYSNDKTETDNDLISCLTKSGLGTELDYFLTLKEELNFVLNNIKSGNFKINTNNKFYGGSNTKLPEPTDNLKSSDSKKQIYKEAESAIYELNQLILDFVNLRQKYVNLSTSFHNLLTNISSMRSCLDNSTKLLLENSKDFEKTIFFTKNDKVYTQIMYNKMKDTPNYASLISQYLPTLNYILIILNKMFENDKDDKFISKELLSPTIEDDCKKRNINNLYFNVGEESQTIQFALLLIDCLNMLILKQFLDRSGTNVTLFCIINDFQSSTVDKIIYKKTIEEDSMLLETINHTDCDKVFPTVVTNTNVTQLQTFKLPFTYIFDKCELEKIPYYIKIGEKIKEHQNSLLITFGYSGVGKSVTIFGKKDKNTGVIIPGLLQYFLKTLNTSFKVEVLEIYGRALPAYESFNIDNMDKNDGYLKTITWIKRYTSTESVQKTGKYDFVNDTHDKYNENTFEYETDNTKEGSLINDPIKIKEYFKKRLTNEFIENSTEMYSVSEDSTISYLEVFSENLVEPVESKRRLLRSIYFTPNNPDSSRSILIYTFAFKTDNKYTVLTIIDFPGKEDPIPTYIYDESTRSVDDFVLKITSGYSLPGLNYNEPYIRTTLQRFSNDPNIKIDTFFNILPFIPLVLLTIDYKTNIAIIEELNKYLDKTKSSNSALSTQINEEIKNILDNILNEKIIDNKIPFNTFVSIQKFDNLSANRTIFPKIEVNKTDKSDNFLIEDNKILDTNVDYKNSFVFFASNGNIIDSPNILRFYYIILIFKQLLKSKFFSNNDVISILIKVIFNDLNNNTNLKKFIPLQSNIFCSKLNNIFEAYFINETIALLIRSLIQLSSDEPKFDIINKMYQGDKLTLNYLGDYLIKRLNTGNYTYTGADEKFNNYNPLINPSDASKGGNKIYYISNNTNDKYDQDKLKKIKDEVNDLYNYSKLISKPDNNNVLKLLNILPEKSKNGKLTIYMLYLVSNVQSNMKCKGANSLLLSLEEILQCIVKGVCK